MLPGNWPPTHYVSDEVREYDMVEFEGIELLIDMIEQSIDPAQMFVLKTNLLVELTRKEVIARHRIENCTDQAKEHKDQEDYEEQLRKCERSLYELYSLEVYAQ